MAAERRLLEELEPALREWGDGQACAMVALVAGEGVPLPADELQAALRRALLIVAAEGDPRRELDVEGRAVTGFAADLDVPDRRAALEQSLHALRREAEGLPRTSYLLDALLADPQLAWRSLAVALLADELGDDDGDVPRTG